MKNSLVDFNLAHFLNPAKTIRSILLLHLLIEPCSDTHYTLCLITLHVYAQLLSY